MMSPRNTFAIVQVLGGVAVLGSYAHSFANHADPAVLWGTIPPEVIPPYTACMPFAAMGYLVSAWYLWRVVDPREVQLGGLGYGAFIGAFAVLTLASALWMPLSLAAVDAQAPWLWAWIQVDLAATGGASLFILAGIWQCKGMGSDRAWKMALVGWLLLCWQTVVLDCLVWPQFFVI